MPDNLMVTLNIFAKIATIGEVILVATVLLRFHRKTREVNLMLLLCLCVCCYMFLTIPHSKEFFAQSRALFFPFTEALSFVVWSLCYQIFTDSSNNRNIPKWPVVPVLIFTLALVLKSAGVISHGQFSAVHDFTHWVELMVLGHAFYMTYVGLVDDLLESRRKKRLFVIVLFGCYFIMLVIFEIVRIESGYDDLFGALNAFVVLIITTVIGTSVFQSSQPSTQQASDERPDSLKQSQANQNDEPLDDIPVAERPLFALLMQHMDEGQYRQSDLTISQLAEQLKTPEHQLRKLINQHLNFNNFSTFLNSYRIKEACEHLQDITQAKTPILTIAMGLGYGSIGPFNRAFKTTTGQTPSQYRQANLDKQA